MPDSPDRVSGLSVPWDNMSAGSRSGSSRLEPTLFNRRVSTRYPDAMVGRHLAFGCIADDGTYFYCKQDIDAHPARATEWIATRIADRVGIIVPPCAVLEDDGRTYFGSQEITSLADQTTLDNFLLNPQRNELLQPSPWPGEYLAMLRAFDRFMDNPDRCPSNFLLANNGFSRNLCAIDFASARLLDCAADRFPVESEATMFVGRLHERIHGVFPEAAREMLGRIASIPASVVEGILGEMPSSWLSERQRGNFDAFWSDGRRRQRIDNLRASIGG